MCGKVQINRRAGSGQSRRSGASSRAKELSCCDGELEKVGTNSDEVVTRCAPNGKGIRMYWIH